MVYIDDSLFTQTTFVRISHKIYSLKKGPWSLIGCVFLVYLAIE